MAPKATKRPPAGTTRAKTVASYVAAAPKDQRAALMKLRKAIKAAAPKAKSISYGMAGFRCNGKRLAYFSYWKDHCALYGVGKGTIKFSADKPLADRLVTKLIRAKIAWIETTR